MKKILTLTLALLTFFAWVFPGAALSVWEEPTYVYDNAELLSTTDAGKLDSLLSQINQKHGVCLMIVTADYLYQGVSVETVANAAYQNYKTSENGAVFLISLSEREWYIQGFGTVKEIYSEDVLDLLEESCVAQLTDGNYYEAFESFASVSDEMIALAEAGTPYRAPFPWLENIAIALVIGFVIALIVVGILAAQLKSVRRQTAAREYMKPGSLNVTEQRDLYLYTTVTKVPRPKSNGSSGGGGGGGGGGGRGGRF